MTFTAAEDRDLRPLETLTLAMLPTGQMVEPEPGLKLVPEHKIDETTAARVREILAGCGVKTAEDIVELGCTGLAYNNVPLDDIKLVRQGLSGSGVGLTCFVGTDRYCLAHETVGGLQDGQPQRHVDGVSMVSRELTTEEQLKVATVETARRLQDPSKNRRMTTAADALSGRKRPDGFLKDVVDTVAPPDVEAAPEAVGPRYQPGGPDDPSPRPSYFPPAVPLAEANFVCPDHSGDPVWDCRYCIAQQIVRGNFVPVFKVQVDEFPIEDIKNEDINAKIETLDSGDTYQVRLFVQAVRWRRKLAID